MNMLDGKVAGLFRNAGLTLAVAESCSGGLIAKRITDIPGSSGYFILGVVTYANSAKTRVLGVAAELLEKNGAVSPAVAAAMAKGVRNLAGSDIAIATTGIAGPEGGSAEKPVGTVFIALASAASCEVFRHRFTGDRVSIREATAEAALMLLSNRVPSAGIA